MLAKWKTILTNWINCYFNTATVKQQSVTTESLLTIIEHLRENFGLDESKSSLLEAHTIEEFVAEKYPDITLNELDSEDEVYIVASLLLYFVCVTSKDVNIKNAMCNKLSSKDQEIILKFSRCLMESETITCKEVEAAVLEACGQDIAGSPERRPLVAETPPALRSLHGEVRRLQAALDAERFDRNYLQEELTRSNHKIEKLTKEKEECKSDILNLRAAMCSCCGEESSARPAGGGDSAAARLLRQVDDLERRLARTCEQLDELTYERDAYKTKVDELKQEREKWVSFSQQESSRASRLAEQLAAERASGEGLRELVAELRQHNRHNGLDGSQLECDDPNASVHSFVNNASMCSEACANVVEIQLVEERAKIVELQQQIQALQEQIEAVNRKAEDESLSLHKILTDKEGDILELKHRINEEIEEKDGLKAYYNDQCMRLNNEINELEQKMKETNKNTTKIIETNREEIKTLQEEKLSILQSLNDETSKLKDIIKTHEATIQSIQSDLYTERNSKQTMREDYENHMMKLKEKVLNRNNECVELQNNVCEKSEKIEALQCEIRKANEERKQVIKKFQQEICQLNKHKSSLDRNLTQKSKEIQQLNAKMEEKLEAFDHLSQQISNLQDVVNHKSDEIKLLEDARQKLTEEVRICNEELAQVRSELEKVKHDSAEQVKSFRDIMEERKSVINSLQAQLKDELSVRNTLENEIAQLYTARTEIADELSRLSGECERLTQVVQEKDRMIDGMDLYLNEEKETSAKLRQENNLLKESISKLSVQIKENDDEISALRNVLDNELKSHNDDNLKKDELIKQLEKDKYDLTSLNLALEETKKQLIDDFTAQTNENSIAQKKCSELTATIEDRDKEIKSLQQILKEQQTHFEELQTKYDKETSKLTTRVKETERILKELRSKSNKSIEDKNAEIISLKNNVEAIAAALESEKQSKQVLAKELEVVIQQKQALLHDCSQMKVQIEELTLEVAEKSEGLAMLREQNNLMRETIEKDVRDSAEQKQKIQLEIITLKNEMQQQRQTVAEHNLNLASFKNSLVEYIRSHLDESTDIKEADISNLPLDNLCEMIKKIFDQLNDFWTNKIHKLNAIIADKEKHLEEFEQQITNVKNSFNLKISELNIEHQTGLKQALAVEIDKYENLDHERLVLADQLAEERAFVEDLQAENQTLLSKQDELKELVHKEQTQKKTVCEERDSLLTKLDDLNDQITKAQHETAILFKQNEVLVQEKEILAQHYKEVEEALQKQNEKLLNDKEMLTQQLLEEKSIKDVILHEKDALVAEKQTEMVEKKNLIEELEKEKSIIDSIQMEKSSLIEQNNALNLQIKSEIEAKMNIEDTIKTLELEIKKLKDTFVKEKEVMKSGLEITNQKLNEEQTEKQVLLNDKEELTQKLRDQEAQINMLVQEKHAIVIENEDLLKRLSEEKVVRDQTESEKTTQVAKLEQECRKWSNEMSMKTEELTKVREEMKCLQEAGNAKQENIHKISSTINFGLTRILASLNNELIPNELKQKLASAPNTNRTIDEQCELLMNISEALLREVTVKEGLVKSLEAAAAAAGAARDRLQDTLNKTKDEQARKSEAYAASLEEKLRASQQLQQETTRLRAELSDAKLQLELKVHSLKEKLVDNENLTEKLKSTYECQIENLNVMSNKLTNYLKDKAAELDALRRERDRLLLLIEENDQAMKSQDEEIKLLKQSQEKLITDFESERLVLKNMVSVTESVMEDQKTSFEKIIAEQEKAKLKLESENRECKQLFESEKLRLESVIKEKEVAFDSLFNDLKEERKLRESRCKEYEAKANEFKESIKATENAKNSLEFEMKQHIASTGNDLNLLIEKHSELNNQKNCLEVLLKTKESELQQVIIEKQQIADEKEALAAVISLKDVKIKELETNSVEIESTLTSLNEKIVELTNEKNNLESEKNALVSESNVLKSEIDDLETENNVLLSEKAALESINNALLTENTVLLSDKNALLSEKEALESEKHALKSENKVLLTEKNTLESEKVESAQKLDELIKLQKDNVDLMSVVEEKKTVISNLEQQIISESEQNKQLRDSNSIQQNLESRCDILEQYQRKAEKLIEEREGDVKMLEREVQELKSQVEVLETQLNDKNTIISKVSKELFEEKAAKDKLLKQLEGDGRGEAVAVKKENHALQTAHTGVETGRRGGRAAGGGGGGGGGGEQQVDTSTSDLASSADSSRTVSDPERALHERSRALTALRGDGAYLKTLLADSETKLLDVTRDLHLAREANHQLSSQLNKIVQQKNDEIADLKKQLSKMSVTENRASQIIKVSAKYQAIILKRIAEIKTNTVLKELTNFGSNAAESELRKSIVGSVTMEDLENFLETTDRHLKRFSEKQVTLQKERDRLAEVNRINESELINMKKFLTEMSVSIKTLNSVKEVYTQKMSRVVAVQRTVRREILNLEGRVTDSVMCKLERGYAAVMQDLAECALNIERWAARGSARALSPEKIKQAHNSDQDRPSLASETFQSTSLEVQLDELEKSFQKLLEEVLRAHRVEAAKEAQVTTVMEVRAEYEDKLNRMKAKMKQLYQEQISIFREKQKEEIAVLENELQKAREKLIESSRGYEDHIRGLTTELWAVGEKLLAEREQAAWLRRRQRQPSLMSLQDLHNSTHEDPRQSDAASLRSLPVHNTHKPDRRKNTGLHMSDEEGEVFDNRWLKELATPRRPAPGARLSELRWRNSLCPPHLKSSYPAETQFAGPLNEDDIKAAAAGRPSAHRKEVGITAYKKPGPPTPSKQAGRLSATDGELRESLRPDGEPGSSAAHARKTTTPSRIRALFFSSKNDTNDGTPRRRLSIFRNKK